MELPIEIILQIIELLPCIDQLRLNVLSKTYYEAIYIKRLWDDIPHHNLTNDVLNQPRFRYLQSLNLRQNIHVTDINHLTELTTLSVSNQLFKGSREKPKSVLTDAGIKGCTKLQNLYVTNNQNFKNINHLVDLQGLAAGGNCGLSDAGIKNCTKLQILLLHANKRITDINHFTELTRLEVWFDTKLTDASIKGCTKLQHLILTKNINITPIPNITRWATIRLIPRKVGTADAES